MLKFDELLCFSYGVDYARYSPFALRACLHWPARVLYGPIHLFAPNFFAADFDLINNVAQLTSTAGLELDIAEYYHHPYNQSRLRRSLKLCVSTRRLRSMVRSTFRSQPSTRGRATSSA